MKIIKKLHIKFNDSLNPHDTELQTYGCRASNPYICGSCYIVGVCAFASDDEICKKPSLAWKKQFEKLRREQ